MKTYNSISNKHCLINKINILFCITITSLVFLSNVLLIANEGNSAINIDIYYKDRIYIKTKNVQQIDNKFNVTLSNNISNSFKGIKGNSIELSAPFARHFLKYGGKINSSKQGLDRLYKVVFNNNIDVVTLCEEISKNSDVEYAEPIPMVYLLEYKPNDPNLSTQWHLKDIDVYNAWEVVKDKTAVLVGIVDSGTDLEHPDLADNAWKNPKEQFNGIDDDNNGYIDDLYGWDFVGSNTSKLSQDNNVTPSSQNNYHGTHVTGLIAATANI
jgi:hypothetical protein